MVILVVDDERLLRDIITRSLSAEGHTVCEAETAEAALAILDSKPIEVVITDIRMPGRSGIELLRAVKNAKPEVEVILMTGYAVVEEITTAIDAHAFAHLRKPFHMVELSKVVEQAGTRISLARALKASEQRYRSLVEGIAAAVLSTDRDLIITSASERCAAVLGYTPPELVGQPLDILRPPGRSPEQAQETAAILAQGSGFSRVNSEAARADGTIICTQETVTPFLSLGDGSPDGFFWLIEDVTAQQQLRQKVENMSDHLDAIRRSRSPSRTIVGKSPAIEKVLELVSNVASSSASVLISGESGTGKDLIAESLHINSPRAEKPFVIINCAALQDALLESELFGHKRGAFTGALQEKRGLVEIADGGTLFVDEVAEMTPAIQAKVLRVLEQGQFRRVGCTEDRVTDVRVVAATNKDLAAEVRAGRFREDLFYRLNVIRIELPPLRSRREDILLIAEHLLQHSMVTPQRPKRLTADAIKTLMAYDWPGNIRELSNVIERAVILSGNSSTISPEFLSGLPTEEPPVKRLQDIQQAELERALTLAGGNKTMAARMLGITRQTIASRLKRLGREHGRRATV